MSDTSYFIGNTQSSLLDGSDSLKSGPTPRDVEVLERWHRNRVHAQRGDPNQAHQIGRAESADLEPNRFHGAAQSSIMDVVA